MNVSTLIAAASTTPTSGEQPMPLGELLVQGGWAMYPIYACSILGLGIFVHKLLELKGARLGQVRWLEGVLDQVRDGDLDAAALVAGRSVHPGARVLEAVLGALRQQPGQAESEAKRVASLQLQRLEKNLGVLSFLAQVSPLLGLLGTVIGMVDLFMGMQGAEQGALAISDLASGIWKALLTTAAGLTVAVPALAAHTYLTSKVDYLRLQLSDMVQRVLFAAGLAESEEQP